MQVIYHCTTFLRSWSSLHRMENYNLFTKVSTRLEEFLSNMGDNIISGLDLHRLRSRYSFMSISCIELFFYALWLLSGYVHLNYVETRYNV
jgi:hypothetical protein